MLTVQREQKAKNTLKSRGGSELNLGLNNLKTQIIKIDY
jgi:hypothetical protein